MPPVFDESDEDAVSSEVAMSSDSEGNNNRKNASWRSSVPAPTHPIPSVALELFLQKRDLIESGLSR